MYTLQPSPLPPPPLKAYLEPRADARVTPAIHPTTPLSLEIASKSPMMLPLLAAVVTSMRRVATISTGWQTVYPHSPARQPSVSKDTRAEVGSASSLVEEARPPSGFNISLQTAPDLLEGVLEGVETRGDGCAPSRPRSYTLAAWGPSTLTHSAVKFGAIALYFCTSFCASL